MYKQLKCERNVKENLNFIYVQIKFPNRSKRLPRLS